MVLEYGTTTLFLKFSCAEYESAVITNNLRKVNSITSSYDIGELGTEDPLFVTRKFLLKYRRLLLIFISKCSVLG